MSTTGATILTSASITFVGSWSAYTGSGSFNGEPLYYDAAGTGTNKAIWEFTGLTPGATYYLGLDWNPSSNRATDTPWTVDDSNGTTVLATGTMNQLASAVGPIAGTVPFNWLGDGYTPSGTTLTITITDNANGYVIADAAYLLPATAPGAVCSAIASGYWSNSATWAPYQPCKPFTITGAANNGSGLIRLTLGASTNWTTGNQINVLGVTGTTEANGSWIVTVIDSTHVDLQGSTFTNAYVSGGSAFRADSVVIAPGVTVDLDSAACDANGLIIVGSDPGTGGTAAITIGSTSQTSATNLIVNTGLILRLRGDLDLNGSRLLAAIIARFRCPPVHR